MFEGLKRSLAAIRLQRTGLYLHNLVQPAQTTLFGDTFTDWELNDNFRGAYTTIDQRDENGQTLLHLAAESADASLVQLLLQKGADVNLKCNKERSALIRAVYNKDINIVPVLIQAGAELGATAEDGYSALHHAAGAGKLEALDTLLEAGADVYCSSDSGISPLELACAQGQIGAIKRLLQAGVDPRNIKGNNEHRLLHLSVAAGDVEMTTYICQLYEPWDEFDISSSTNSDWRYYQLQMFSILTGASIKVQDRFGRSAVHIAAGLGHADVLNIIFEVGPGAETLANERVVETGKSALHFAVEEEQETVVELLIAAGADSTQQDKSGITPIILARNLGRESMLAKLEKACSIQTLTSTDKDADFASFLFADDLSQGRPLIVPLVCSEDFIQNCCHGIPWLEYPAQHGWTMTDTLRYRRTDNSQHTKEQLSSFFQSWLFFGLVQWLFDLAGAKFNWKKLLYKDVHGKTKISTRHLPSYLQEWSFRCHLLPDDVLELIDSTLQIASTLISTFEFDATLMDANQEDGPKRGRETAETIDLGIAISISLLVWLLVGYRHEMRDRKVERYEIRGQRSRKVLGLPEPSESLDSEDSLSPRKILSKHTGLHWYYSQYSRSYFMTHDLMLAEGWCKSDATILHSLGLGPAALYFMSRLERKRPKEDHSTCTEHKCVAHNINEASYATQHVDAQCQCEMIHADKEAVVAAVMNGKIPIISICLDEACQDGDIRIEVEEQTGYYYAVSHVWADGLGNPNQNALPRCQLIRLKALLAKASDVHMKKAPDDTIVGGRGLTKSVPFWLDTLCIPLQKPARSKALRLLSNVYRNASATLVLDKELMNISSTTSSTELQARIIMSTWMRRLWTLEEALLSTGRLIFQFKQTCLRYPDDMGSEEDFRQTSEIYGDIHHRHLFNSIANCLHGAIPSTWDTHRKYELSKLNLLALGLSSRTTSHPADEFICLASLLDLDIELISQAPAEERPYLFYTQLGNASNPHHKISPSILFANGPRLTRPGFRWAPASFLSRTPNLLFDLKFGRTRTDDYSSHSGADYSSGMGLQFKQGDDHDKLIGLKPAYLRRLGLFVEMHAWMLDIRPQTVLDFPFAFKAASSDSTHLVRYTAGDVSILRQSWASCARVAILWHELFSPWGLLVVVPYPLHREGWKTKAGQRPFGEYGLHACFVIFGAQTQSAEKGKESRNNLEEKEEERGNGMKRPNFSCMANKHGLMVWCIG